MKATMQDEESRLALDTAIAALQAVGNLMMTLADLAHRSGAPREDILEALLRFQGANDAVILQPNCKAMLARQVALARNLYGPTSQ